jgi:hypothetical protein
MVQTAKKNVVYLFTLITSTEFALLVCLFTFLSYDDLVEFETGRGI